MSKILVCPQCNGSDVFFSKKRKHYICEDCHHTFETEQEFEPHRIFISYGHDQHAALAERLRDDLLAIGHEVWFDKDRLRPGGDFEAYIEDGLEWVAKDKSGGRFVLLMTPHSVRRPDGYCLNEIARAISRGLPIIPLMVEESEPPLSICRIQWLDMTDCQPVDQRLEKYESRFERLAEALQDLDKIDFEGIQSRLLHLLDPPKFEANINDHLKRFTGRQWVFDDINAWLKEPNAPRIFWIVGDPGVGKTAITSYLCYHNREIAAFHLCQFANLEKSDPRKCVLSIAYQLSSQLPDYQSRLNSLNLEKLIPDSNALTLFDTLVVQPLSNNFPAPDRIIAVLIDALDEATKDGKNELADFLASHFTLTPAWLRLIITSRPDPEVLHPLQAYTPYQLEKSLSKNREDLRSYLVRELKPFAAAGALSDETVDFILDRSEGLFLYVQYIREEIEFGRLSLDHLAEFPKGLGGSYRKFFDRQFPDIRDFQNNVRAPLEVICTSQEPVGVEMLAAVFDWNDYQLHDFKQSVGSFFPEVDGRIQPFHRSLADWLTDPEKAGKFLVSTKEGHKCLADYGRKLYLKSAADLPDYFLRHLPQHLIALSRWEHLEEFLSDLYVFEKIRNAGRRYEWMRYWQHLIDRSKPGEWYQKALDKVIADGVENQKIAHLEQIIGSFLRDMGLLAEAQPFLEQSLKLREAVLGEDHPEIADSVHNLAELNRAQNNFDQAQPLYMRALEIRKNKFGKESAEVAKSFHDMAEFFHDQHKYAQALDYYQQALEISERVHKPNDPAIADCLNDLGALRYELGNSAEAMPLYDRALEIYISAHEKDHPDSAAVLHNKARIYSENNKYDDAVRSCSNALDILERTFPPHHPDVQTCLKTLEGIYATGGDTQKVILLRKRLFEIKEQIFGPNHLDLIRDLKILISLFHQIGDSENALETYQRVLAILENAFGRASSEYVEWVENLAWTLLHQGDGEKAISYARQAAQFQEKVSGPDHPATAASVNTLLRCLQENGDHSEALPFCRKALSIRENCLDADDPKIAESLNNLGLTLVCLDQLAEAEDHLLRAVLIDPLPPNPFYWLAKLYQKRDETGDHDRETENWSKYLEHGAPIPARREEAVARLADLENYKFSN